MAMDGLTDTLYKKQAGAKVVKTGNPYHIKKLSSGKFQVCNRETGDVKGTFDSYAGALKQFNLLEGLEHGMKARGKK